MPRLINVVICGHSNTVALVLAINNAGTESPERSVEQEREDVGAFCKAEAKLSRKRFGKRDTSRL